MSDQPDEALEVLRGVWNAQQQTAADLGDDENPKTCKRMADVGFGGMACRRGPAHRLAEPAGPGGQAERRQRYRR